MPKIRTIPFKATADRRQVALAVLSGEILNKARSIEKITGQLQVSDELEEALDAKTPEAFSLHVGVTLDIGCELKLGRQVFGTGKFVVYDAEDSHGLMIMSGGLWISGIPALATPSEAVSMPVRLMLETHDIGQVTHGIKAPPNQGRIALDGCAVKGSPRLYRQPCSASDISDIIRHEQF